MYSLKLLLLSLIGFSTGTLAPNIESKVVPVQNTGLPKTLSLHGWLPFWAKASGTVETLSHGEYFSTISPFSMEINNDGSIFNRFKNDKTVISLLNATGTRKYKVVPTIAWFDGNQIDNILSNQILREIHVNDLVGIVVSEKYDGIDIDYEGKYLRTKPSYSAFITELSTSLHKNKKILQCTVEARTPAEDRYLGVLREMSHASDYKVLNKYCDTVRIMAYDQRDDDKALVVENEGSFYRPVADPTWVEKTIKEALYEINRRKLVIGVPTYGNVYKQVKKGDKNYYSYVSAISYNNAIARAKEYGVDPQRNTAGELQFSYNKDGAKYFATFTDAVAVKKKLILAEKYGLNGIALFKIDGGMDQNIWKELNRKIKI